MQQSHVYMYCRSKREDPCLTCNRLPSKTDATFNAWNVKQECWSRNLMVCESCNMRYIMGVAVNTTANGFRIWCFDSGAFQLEV